MEAEILTKPPLSGDYEEHDFSGSGNTLWVKFFDEEWTEWCGVFGLGMKCVSLIHNIPNKPIFLVVAGGQGYFVNVNTRIIVDKTEWDDIEAIIYNDEIEAFVVSDGLCLAIIKDNKLIWASNRISLDGVTFFNSSGSIVKGILNDCSDEGCEFEFDVNSRAIKSEWLFSNAVR